MTTSLQLGALDYLRSLEETLTLAPTWERLGYDRLWITHHRKAESHSSPAMVASLIAGMTDRIRVGTAGVLLRYYPALQVADDFRLLGYLYQGRIDAGFCAGGVDGASSAALSPIEAADYETRVRQLVRYVRADQLGDGEPIAVLEQAAAPELWYLGSSVHGARLAGELGTRFAYCLHFTSSVDSTAAVDAYRAAFAEHHGEPPEVCLSVAGVCRTSAASASETARACRNAFAHAHIVGTPEQCAAQLDELASRYRTRAFVLADMSETTEGTVETYGLLAEQLALG